MPRFDNTTGRYVYLAIDGLEYRVYFERAGTRVPLLLQHTAGADGRQWRHVLEDPRVTEHFNVIAYDLPYHGNHSRPRARRGGRRSIASRKTF
jgi:pimeloyl-ACP methyl ester carboxylesterase